MQVASVQNLFNAFPIPMKRKTASFHFPSCFFWFIVLGASLTNLYFGQLIGIGSAALYFAQSLRRILKSLQS